MKIEKAIKSKVKRDYFFTQGHLDIDCKYFIKQIDKGVSQNNNDSEVGLRHRGDLLE